MSQTNPEKIHEILAYTRLTVIFADGLVGPSIVLIHCRSMHVHWETTIIGKEMSYCDDWENVLKLLRPISRKLRIAILLLLCPLVTNVVNTTVKVKVVSISNNVPKPGRTSFEKTSILSKKMFFSQILDGLLFGYRLPLTNKSLIYMLRVYPRLWMVWEGWKTIIIAIPSINMVES